MKKSMSRWLPLVAILTSGAALAQTGGSEYKSTDAQLMRKYSDATRLYEKARVAFGTVKVVDGVAVKDLDGARKHLNKALELIPELGDAHLLMAKILYIEKNYEGALAEVQKARSGFSATSGLSERMQTDRTVELRKRRRDKQDAIPELRARLSTTPVELQPPILNAIARMEKEIEEIDRQLDSAGRSGPTEVPAEYSFVHGNVLLRMQRYAEAAEQYTEALRVQPKYGEAANNLASLYYSTKQYDKAIDVVAQAEANGLPFSPDLKKAIEAARAPKTN